MMGRHLLMQSLLGHLALLAEKHPKKASTAVAKRMKLEAVQALKPRREPIRRAA